MSTKLAAEFLFSEIEDGIIMVGFADDENNPNEHILFQKSLEVDEQDKNLGHDKVHITYIDELYSSYGGILKIILKNGHIEIVLDSKTAQALGTEECIQIFLSSNIEELEKLKWHLELMFKNENDVFINQL